MAEEDQTISNPNFDDDDDLEDTEGDYSDSEPDNPTPKLDPTTPLTTTTATTTTTTPKPSAEESRRLFQRLWTDDDELKILKGFLEFTSSRGTTFASHQYDTGPFYDQIKNQLQLDFTKNQLIEKLRRLKKKYRNTANRMGNHGSQFTFKSPHEKATYEIAKKIWSASIKRSRESDDDDNIYGNNNNMSVSDAPVSSRSRSRRRGRKRTMELSAVSADPVVPVPLALPPPPSVATPTPGVVKVEVQTAALPDVAMNNLSSLSGLSSSSVSQIPGIIEETVKSCLSPIFKELLSSAVNGSTMGGIGLNSPLLNIGGSTSTGNDGDEKWRKQKILELEVYLKRVELVREQIKSTLEELRASPSPS